MALAKQFDFQVTGRGTLGDPTLPVSASNLNIVADIVTINGVSMNLATLDSSAVTSMVSALESIIQKANRTVQTIALVSASVGIGETAIITADGISVTYTNSSGAAVAGAALATALKTACDASAAFLARFDSSVSTTNLVLTQKAPQSRIALVTVTGTGIAGGDAVTVTA